MAIHRNPDPNARGLAAALATSDIPPWGFDQRAVEPGEDVLFISDWHKRHGWANNKDGNIDQATAELVDPVPLRTTHHHER